MKHKEVMVTPDFTERFLYHIWDAQHLKSDLQTVSGKGVKVISPGRLSNAACPDFREAVISIGGDLQRGDVEIHKTTYDWHNHKHSEDPNYCNVILHVVFVHNTWQEYTLDKDANGNICASGIFYVRIKTESLLLGKKMLLLK